MTDVMTPEEKWTDARLDDLDKKVDGFARADKSLGDFRGEVNTRFEKVESKIEGGIKELRGEMNERFDKVDSKFDKVDAKFDTLDAKFDKKFDRLTYYIWGLGAGIITTLIASLAALIGPNVL